MAEDPKEPVVVEGLDLVARIVALEKLVAALVETLAPHIDLHQE